MNVETSRLVFTAVFFLLVFALWQRWEQRQYELNNPTAVSAPSVPGATEAEVVDDPELPKPTVDLQTGAAREEVPSASEVADSLSEAQSALLSSNWLEIKVSTKGGDIVEAGLKKHVESDVDPSPFRLLKSGPDGVFVAQSGLIGGDLPNHKSDFSLVGADGAALSAPAEGLSLTLLSETPAASVRKVLSLENDSYIVSVEFDIRNTGPEPLTVFAYHQFLHDGTEPQSYSSFLPTFFGAAVYNNEERFNKVTFDEFDSGGYPRKSGDGWVGLIERYFLAAWLGGEGEREFFLRETGSGYAAGTIVPVGVIAPGESRNTRMPVYIGAQEQDSLHELSESGVAPGIDLAVDYGFLTIIAEPMFWVLARTNDLVDNWGIAIILVTCLIKLLFFPLSAASYRSMARMRAVAPRMQRIKEKHGEDKQAMQRALMDLYREEKINPFGGCLPILLQIPFFIALYWVLLGSVELRSAPFLLWITDLSTPDPWYVMSLMLGGLMLAQTKLNPTPPDPTQAMIVKFIPLVFTVFSVFFPSGLVLYWVVNTLLSILQQWQITRVVDAEKANARRS